MLLLLLLPATLAQPYTSEPTVKLLSARLFGDLFPAAESEYRVSSDGEDQDIELSERDLANGMPDKQLVLQPGNSAEFRLPLNKELVYLMVKPGKKEVEHGSPYKDKANLTVHVAADEGGDPVDPMVVECSVSSADSSSLAHRYCILDLQPLHDLFDLTGVMVNINVPDTETRSAFIWQLHLSPLDESDRVEGTFEESGRKLMRKTQEEEATNTWLTMVSIVGNTGVGKSTVASLLSGNDTMFKVAASSSGTTTIGADISPIIPSEQYSARMEEVLDSGPLHNTNRSRPLFLIDSEGMGFRGDEVDFVTTGPVAIIANIIVWITTDRMRPPEILEKVDEYMKGLDRITMGDESSEQQAYGEFIIVLNKMQEADEGSTDEEMLFNLMEYGDDEGDNDIRDEMYNRFKSISCIGFPTVVLEEGEPFGYPVLQRYPRFTEGLMKLGNRLLNESETMLDVTVGTQTYEMNSTDAETIIGMLIDGANKGNIDLSDFCNVIGSITKEKVIQEMGKLTSEMDMATQDLCDPKTQLCTACACEYRVNAVEFTVNELNAVIANSIEEASLLCEGRPDVIEEITELLEDFIQPWAEVSGCEGSMSSLQPSSSTTTIESTAPSTSSNPISGTTTPGSGTAGSTSATSHESTTSSLSLNQTTTSRPTPVPIPTQCDISIMNLVHPEQEVAIACVNLFVCGSFEMNAKSINISTNYIYVAHYATIKTAKLDQANDGNEVVGEEGGRGADGISAGNLTINASKKLTSCYQQLTFTSTGQKGGNGGSGSSGLPMGGFCSKYPHSEKEVAEFANNKPYDTSHTQKTECHVHHCHSDYDYFYYKYEMTNDDDSWCCGHDGTKGGGGGNGGAAGTLTILGDSGLDPINNRNSANGGNGGTGGTGGLGYIIDKVYFSYYLEYESAECGFGSDWTGCDYDDRTRWGGWRVEGPDDIPCDGQPGDRGDNGDDWNNSAEQ